MGWGWGGVCAFLTHHHTSAAVGVPLPPLPVGPLCVSGAGLEHDAEHSLTDLDFCDQLARRLFCVRGV